MKHAQDLLMESSVQTNNHKAIGLKKQQLWDVFANKLE